MESRHDQILPLDGLAGLKQNWKADLTSGFLVFLIALPLCLGISLASGFPPIAGIFTAIIGGILVSILGDGKMTIKGPAAGLIAIAIASVTDLGQGNNLLGYKLTLAVIVVAGVLQVGLGLIRAGVLSDFFPSSVVHGMLAAIGIIIFSKQIHVLLGVAPISKAPLGLLAEIPHSISVLNPEIVLIGLVSLIILFTLPLIKNKYIKKIPAPMLVLLYAVPVGLFLDLDHEHVYRFLGGDYKVNSKFLVTLPYNILDGITFPDFSQITSYVSIKYIVMFTLVGSIESLLTVKAMDVLDPFRRKSNMNRDLLAVGAGNTLAGFIGGLPMIAEVVRSSANINNGAKTRWANFFHGVFLLFFVSLFPFVIHQIPLAALAAMLIFTGYRLASPKEFVSTYKIGIEQLIIFCTTIFFTLYEDLLVGVIAGMVVKMIIALIIGAPITGMFRARVKVEEEGDNITIIAQTPAVFTNYLSFKSLLEKLPKGKNIKLDFSESNVLDHTFTENIHHFGQDYYKEGGHFELTGLEYHRPLSLHPHATRIKTKKIQNEASMTTRQKNLVKKAIEINAEFLPSVAYDTAKFSEFPLFLNYRIQYYENRVIKKIPGEDITLEFSDIYLLTGKSLRESKTKMSVLLVHHLTIEFPDFIVRHEGILDKIVHSFGYRDINFDAYPVFSAKYLLLGKDEGEIRKFFDPALLVFFESNSGYRIESNENRLLIYHDIDVLNSKEMAGLFNYTDALLKTILLHTVKA